MSTPDERPLPTSPARAGDGGDRPRPRRGDARRRVVRGGRRPDADAQGRSRAGPPPTITFYGRGYGHGVGMSQYGARGRALAGQDAATILAHYYRGTTLGATEPRPRGPGPGPPRFRPTTAAPLRLYGRGGTWTIDGVAGTFPRGARLLVTRTATGFRIVVRSAAGVTLLSRSTAADLRVRPTNPAERADPGLVQAGLLRHVPRGHPDPGHVRPGSTPSTRSASTPTSWAWSRPRCRRAGPAEALEAQAIASRSYAARRLHPQTGTCDLYDDTRSQVYRGSLAERPATTAAVVATAGQVLRSGTSIANTLYHSTGGGATENNENVFVSSTGAIVAGPVSYLRGSADRAPDGTAYDAAAPRATWQTAAYTMDELSTIFAGDARTNVGSLTALDLTRVGVSGRLISVTLTGSLGPKIVCRRRLPGRLQQPIADRRSGHVEHARLDRADPLATSRGPPAAARSRRRAGSRRPLSCPSMDHPPAEPGFDPSLPRCSWAGADGPRPDRLMVAYHDIEWGVPVHDDVELFERLALEGFQAGLAWSTILRKREAFRLAFRGFDPAVVVGFGPTDRERLLADAGIVRNRAKVDATIANAARFLAVVAESGSFAAYLAEQAPGPVRALAPGTTPADLPAPDRRLRPAVEGPPPTRLRLRRLDDRVRLHAERRPRRRPPPGLLPLPGLRRDRVHGSREANIRRGSIRK